MTDIWLELIEKENDAALKELYEKRRQLGIERYGTPLQTENGRNSLLDLQEELLDALVYSQQCFLENKLDKKQVEEFQMFLKRYIQVTNNKLTKREPIRKPIKAYIIKQQTYFDLIDILTHLGDEKNLAEALNCHINQKSNCVSCKLYKQCAHYAANGRPVVNYFNALDFCRFLPMEQNKIFMDYLVNPVLV